MTHLPLNAHRHLEGSTCDLAEAQTTEQARESERAASLALICEIVAGLALTKASGERLMSAVLSYGKACDFEAARATPPTEPVASPFSQQRVAHLVGRLRDSGGGHINGLYDREAADMLEEVAQLADSEGSRAVKYLRRAREAEARIAALEAAAVPVEVVPSDADLLTALACSHGVTAHGDDEPGSAPEYWTGHTVLGRYQAPSVRELLAEIWWAEHRYCEQRGSTGEVTDTAGDGWPCPECRRGPQNALATLQAAVPVEGVSREHYLALREAHCMADMDAYFTPRPVCDGAMQRRAFEEGFTRGYDRGAALQAAEPAAKKD